MTKKHFEAAVKKIVSAPCADDMERLRLANLFADFFGEDNPRFKRDLFLKACGVA